MNRITEICQSNDDVKQALLAYIDVAGRNWKQKLSDDWMRAGTSYQGIEWCYLQQLRNSAGPSALQAFKVATIQSLEPIEYRCCEPCANIVAHGYTDLIDDPERHKERVIHIDTELASGEYWLGDVEYEPDSGWHKRCDFCLTEPSHWTVAKESRA